MNKEINENKEIVEKIYKDLLKQGLKFVFSSYYKYAFTYKGINIGDDYTIYVIYGGSADDIYRYDVDADKEDDPSETLEELLETYNQVYITDVKNDITYEYYNDGW